MPSIRKKGKKRHNFWLNESESSLLAELSEVLGVNKTDTLRTMIILATVGKIVPGLSKEGALKLMENVAHNNISDVDVGKWIALLKQATETNKKTKE